MRLFLLAAIALLLLPGQPKDLNRERDADGFGNIKWGMTVAEAKAAFPGLREPERSELTSGAFEERLIQPVLMIGSVVMTVSIQTKVDSDLITRIVLKLSSSVQHRKTAFQFLSNNLIQKYGKPSHHDTAPRGRMKEETEVWVLPSTTITLDWREESAGKFRLLESKLARLHLEIQQVLSKMDAAKRWVIIGHVSLRRCAPRHRSGHASIYFGRSPNAPNHREHLR